VCRPTLRNRLKECVRGAKLFEITLRVWRKTGVRELRRVLDSHP
jgi:hypothetical protein